MSDLPRFSSMEGVILKLLRGHQERYGLEMVKLSEGVLKRGSIYVLLSRLEVKGMVASRLEQGGLQGEGEAFAIPRRMYKITGLGARVLNAQAAAEMSYFGSTIAGAEGAA